MFGCLNQTRKLNTKGVGLGLLISKMIAEEFNGQVSLRSKFGKGSVFSASFKAPNEQTLSKIRQIGSFGTISPEQKKHESLLR